VSTAAFPPPQPGTLIHDRFAASLGAGVGATSIGGSPSADEVAAVIVAIEHLWPKPVLVLPTDTARHTPPWRFSGRWWVRPVASRRERPYT
jgi:hypothetical protein